MKNEIEIYTDGSSLGNPGPGGWGVVVAESGNVVKEFGGRESHTTNNRMELVASIEATKYFIKNYKKEKVIIYADSNYVLGGVTEWVENWERNGWRTANKKQVLNQDLWRELIALTRELGRNISWQKVKGHAGVILNERADNIATTYASKEK